MSAMDEQKSKVFRALADPTRRAIIERLAHSEHTVGALVEPFDMSMAAISKHLNVLENAGIVHRQKRGREKICSLSPDSLREAQQWIAMYSRFWDDRLATLDAALKGEGNE